MLSNKEFLYLYHTAPDEQRKTVDRLLTDESLKEVISLFSNLTPERREALLYVAHNLDNPKVKDIVNRTNAGEYTPEQIITLINELRTA